MTPSLDISLIQKLPPFSDISDAALRDILDAARSLRFKKNENVFEQAEVARNFFLLLDGTIRVVKLTPDGEQVIPRYIAAGELFGIAKALGMEKYPANAVAAIDCVVLSWPTMLWDTLISNHPTFATNTYRTVGKRLAETQEQLVELATARVEQRVANAILKLANQTGRKTSEGILIDFPISRQDISEMTGTTLHTVSRLMSGWEQSGWVKSGRQKITLIEGHKLVMVANNTD